MYWVTAVSVSCANFARNYYLKMLCSQRSLHRVIFILTNYCFGNRRNLSASDFCGPFFANQIFERRGYCHLHHCCSLLSANHGGECCAIFSMVIQKIFGQKGMQILSYLPCLPVIRNKIWAIHESILILSMLFPSCKSLQRIPRPEASQFPHCCSSFRIRRSQNQAYVIHYPISSPRVRSIFRKMVKIVYYVNCQRSAFIVGSSAICLQHIPVQDTVLPK